MINNSRGDQKTIRGPYLTQSKKKIFQSWFWNSPPNSQHLSLQVNRLHLTYQHHHKDERSRTSYITPVTIQQARVDWAQPRRRRRTAPRRRHLCCDDGGRFLPPPIYSPYPLHTLRRRQRRWRRRLPCCCCCVACCSTSLKGKKRGAAARKLVCFRLHDCQPNDDGLYIVTPACCHSGNYIGWYMVRKTRICDKDCCLEVHHY